MPSPRFSVEWSSYDVQSNIWQGLPRHVTHALVQDPQSGVESPYSVSQALHVSLELQFLILCARRELRHAPRPVPVYQ
jgi:hypothetical protein